MSTQKYWWPSEHYSVPADDRCMHEPSAPNRDCRCMRERGHAGKHKYHWSPVIRDYSHKAASPAKEGE